MKHVPQYKRSANVIDLTGPAAGLMTAAMMSMILWLSVVVFVGY